MTDNHDEAFVVADIGCRPPGDATSPESFWGLFVNVLAGHYGIIEVHKNHQNPTPLKKIAAMNGQTVFRDAPCLADLTNPDGESA
jgi:hypothetical protein